MSITGDPSAPAVETLTAEHQTGRFFRGPALTIFVNIRRLAFIELDEFGAPEFMTIRDRSSGAKIGRVSLGRDWDVASSQQEMLEKDLRLLTRQQFLARWLPAKP